MPQLFDSYQLKDVTLRNRIGVSPMCQYSSENGMANDWHLVNLGSRAVGGAGLIIAEATAVEARGRITPGDAGIWAESHIEPLHRINSFIKQHGAVPGIQGPESLDHQGCVGRVQLELHPGAADAARIVEQKLEVKHHEFPHAPKIALCKGSSSGAMDSSRRKD